jgi:hypothetical protein
MIPDKPNNDDARKTIEDRGIELMKLASSDEGLVQLRMLYMLLAADVEPTVSRLLRASTRKMIEAIIDSEYPKPKTE